MRLRSGWTAWVLAAALAGECLASEGGPAAPAPAVPVAAPGKPLDALLAVVEGEVVTRRRIVREIGERTPDEEEAQYEKKVWLTLLDRAQTIVVVRAAQKLGLSIPPDALDRIVAEESANLVKAVRAKSEKARPGSGAGITFERILAERGQTLAEYRQIQSDRVLSRQYFQILVRGAMGKRPQLDLEPSPAEIRRLYDAHRNRFDEQPGLRFAVWVAKPTDFLADGKRTWEEAVVAARAALDGAVLDHAAGRSAAETAKARGISEGADWPAAKNDYVPRGAPIFRKHAAEIEGWLYDPARRAGESRVFPFDDPIAIRIVTTVPGRTRTFEEAQPIVAAYIQDVRFSRFYLTHLLELLSRANATQEVVDDLQARARDELRKIDEDPVKRDVKLR